MEMKPAAWQLDFFGDAAPVKVIPPKRDLLPDPSQWSEGVREKMADALISLACDSRRRDNLPESLADCADMLRSRMQGKFVEKDDYDMTLGWIFGFWNGAVPYAYVCAITGVDPEVLQDIILNHPRLSRDLAEVRGMRCGTLL